MTDVYDEGCAHCEEMMQPYLDHILSDAEVREAEMHLERVRRVPPALPLRGEPAASTCGRRWTSRCRPS